MWIPGISCSYEKWFLSFQWVVVPSAVFLPTFLHLIKDPGVTWEGPFLTAFTQRIHPLDHLYHPTPYTVIPSPPGSSLVKNPWPPSPHPFYSLPDLVWAPQPVYQPSLASLPSLQRNSRLGPVSSLPIHYTSGFSHITSNQPIKAHTPSLEKEAYPVPSLSTSLHPSKPFAPLEPNLPSHLPYPLPSVTISEFTLNIKVYF